MDRNRQVVEMRLRKIKFQEIADRFGISRQRVYQIYRKEVPKTTYKAERVLIPKTPVICRECGKITYHISIIAKTRRFCNKLCQRDWYAKNGKEQDPEYVRARNNRRTKIYWARMKIERPRVYRRMKNKLNQRQRKLYWKRKLLGRSK